MRDRSQGMNERATQQRCSEGVALRRSTPTASARLGFKCRFNEKVSSATRLTRRADYAATAHDSRGAEALLVSDSHQREQHDALCRTRLHAKHLSMVRRRGNPFANSLKRLVARRAAEVDCTRAVSLEQYRAPEGRQALGHDHPAAIQDANWLDAMVVIEALSWACSVTGRIADGTNMGAISAVMPPPCVAPAITVVGPNEAIDPLTSKLPADTVGRPAVGAACRSRSAYRPLLGQAACGNDGAVQGRVRAVGVKRAAAGVERDRRPLCWLVLRPSRTRLGGNQMRAYPLPHRPT